MRQSNERLFRFQARSVSWTRIILPLFFLLSSRRTSGHSPSARGSCEKQFSRSTCRSFVRWDGVRTGGVGVGPCLNGITHRDDNCRGCPIYVPHEEGYDHISQLFEILSTRGPIEGGGETSIRVRCGHSKSFEAKKGRGEEYMSSRYVRFFTYRIDSEYHNGRDHRHGCQKSRV